MGVRTHIYKMLLVPFSRHRVAERLGAFLFQIYKFQFCFLLELDSVVQQQLNVKFANDRDYIHFFFVSLLGELAFSNSLLFSFSDCFVLLLLFCFLCKCRFAIWLYLSTQVERSKRSYQVLAGQRCHYLSGHQKMRRFAVYLSSFRIV